MTTSKGKYETYPLTITPAYGSFTGSTSGQLVEFWGYSSSGHTFAPGEGTNTLSVGTLVGDFGGLEILCYGNVKFQSSGDEFFIVKIAGLSDLDEFSYATFNTDDFAYIKLARWLARHRYDSGEDYAEYLFELRNTAFDEYRYNTKTGQTIPEVIAPIDRNRLENNGNSFKVDLTLGEYDIGRIAEDDTVQYRAVGYNDGTIAKYSPFGGSYNNLDWQFGSLSVQGQSFPFEKHYKEAEIVSFMVEEFRDHPSGDLRFRTIIIAFKGIVDVDELNYIFGTNVNGGLGYRGWDDYFQTWASPFGIGWYSPIGEPEITVFHIAADRNIVGTLVTHYPAVSAWEAVTVGNTIEVEVGYRADLPRYDDLRFSHVVKNFDITASNPSLRDLYRIDASNSAIYIPADTVSTNGGTIPISGAISLGDFREARRPSSAKELDTIKFNYLMQMGTYTNGTSNWRYVGFHDGTVSYSDLLQPIGQLSNPYYRGRKIVAWFVAHDMDTPNDVLYEIAIAGNPNVPTGGGALPQNFFDQMGTWGGEIHGFADFDFRDGDDAVITPVSTLFDDGDSDPDNSAVITRWRATFTFDPDRSGLVLTDAKLTDGTRDDWSSMAAGYALWSLAVRYPAT